jgi:hypothetical protein
MASAAKLWARYDVVRLRSLSVDAPLRAQLHSLSVDVPFHGELYSMPGVAQGARQGPVSRLLRRDICESMAHQLGGRRGSCLAAHDDRGGVSHRKVIPPSARWQLAGGLGADGGAE